MTWVDFTTATASTPGTSPSSRTASLLISDHPVWSTLRAVHGLATTGVPDRGQLAGIGPAPNGVIAYAEQRSDP